MSIIKRDLSPHTLRGIYVVADAEKEKERYIGDVTLLMTGEQARELGEYLTEQAGSNLASISVRTGAPLAGNPVLGFTTL